MQSDSPRTFYEFFCGGGMARLGLGAGWRCAFANDIDPRKIRAYEAAFGESEALCADIWSLNAQSVPGRADLAWASSPCQDLSLAGLRAGIQAPRSGALWGFLRLIGLLDAQQRAPRLIVIENVRGLLNSARGADLAQILRQLRALRYRFGGLEIDSSAFLPQSRPRVFLVAARNAPPDALRGAGPEGQFASAALRKAVARLPEDVRAEWMWWRLPAPRANRPPLVDLLEPDQSVSWFPEDKVERLLALMAPRQIAAVRALQEGGEPAIGTGFRRIRQENGVRIQRFEARFDGLAGCLRTPAGGSSVQVVIQIASGAIAMRSLTGREAARLMGLPDQYPLPNSRTQALSLIGDGVAAPVVRHLARHLIEPLLNEREQARP